MTDIVVGFLSLLLSLIICFVLPLLPNGGGLGGGGGGGICFGATTTDDSEAPHGFCCKRAQLYNKATAVLRFMVRINNALVV